VIDRLGQIIAGLEAAGGGHFQLTLIDDGPDAGKWAVAVVFGREADDLQKSADLTAIATSVDAAVETILLETRWGLFES
jgi:hypothetical protein